MSRTIPYVEPTADLMGQARKKRLLSLTNIPITFENQFHSDLSLGYFLSQFALLYSLFFTALYGARFRSKKNLKSLDFWCFLIKGS